MSIYHAKKQRLRSQAVPKVSVDYIINLSVSDLYFIRALSASASI